MKNREYTTWVTYRQDAFVIKWILTSSIHKIIDSILSRNSSGTFWTGKQLKFNLSRGDLKISWIRVTEIASSIYNLSFEKQNARVKFRVFFQFLDVLEDLLLEYSDQAAHLSVVSEEKRLTWYHKTVKNPWKCTNCFSFGLLFELKNL